jgi:sucrose-6F-phosphate phosphohydrolase
MIKMEKILLACDLDRTVLPNGPQPLSKNAPQLFHDFVSQKHIILAYLSGRNINLIQTAIRKFKIPLPYVAVGDVGTSMYFRNLNSFHKHSNWSKEISPDWNGYSGGDIHHLINDIDLLQLQEAENQNEFKQSYYTPENLDSKKLILEIESRLEKKSINAAIIFSIDEQTHKGLLDIIPASATKKHALQYLQKYLNLNHDQVVYAGDSGNDIQPLTSGCKAILVKNARRQVKDEVKKIAKEKKIQDKLYFAQGSYKRMNGNYVAGILEGLNYFGLE